MSTLKTWAGLKKVLAIDNLPVPAPKSTIIFSFISLNSNPAKKIISTAQEASIAYCSNSTLGLTNV